MKDNEQNENRIGVPVYGLPSKSKCSKERCRWISAIPYLTEEYMDNLKSNPVVCAKQWPANTEFNEKKKRNKMSVACAKNI